MRLLAISSRGHLRPLVEILRQEGHSVVYHVDGREWKWRGDDGLVQGTIQLPSRLITPFAKRLLEAAQPDLLLLDLGMGRLADWFRSQGLQVWGACHLGDIAAEDRVYGSSLLASVNLPAHGEWTTGLWTGHQLVGVQTLSPHFGFLAGGLGPQTLEGVSASPCDKNDTHKGLEALLAKTSYKGPVAFGDSLLIGFYLPFFPATGELVKGPLSSIFDAPSFRSSCLSRTVHISLSPYPNEVSDGREASLFLPESSCRHYWIVGGRSDLGWVSAWGSTPREVGRRVKRSLSAVREQEPEVQYRVDLI